MARETIPESVGGGATKPPVGVPEYRPVYGDSMGDVVVPATVATVRESELRELYYSWAGDFGATLCEESDARLLDELAANQQRFQERRVQTVEALSTLRPPLLSKAEAGKVRTALEELLDDEESSVAARRDELKILKLSALISFTNDNYSTSQLPASWINWVICCTFGIEALTIGYNLSIGPIFLLNTFERGPGIIGVIFAVGEIIGTIFAVGSSCTGRGKALMRSIAKSPFDLCFAMGGIAVGVLVAAAPIFGLHVAGVFLLMSFNDLGATLMTELQASITTASSFAVLGPAGQVVRRAINVATALTGPVLFGWYPRMPYFVAGGVTIIWTVLLFVAFSLRRKQTVKTVAHQTGSSRRSVRHRMSFATGEVVHTMGKHHPSLSRLREEE